MPYVSGSIGYSYLKNKNKEVLSLADDHSLSEYCNNTNAICIDRWLDKTKNTNIYIEEVERKNVRLKELWPNAIHTQRLKNWYLENKYNDNVIPIDIRPFLIPFDWKLMFKKSIYGQFKLNEYIKPINIFLYQENYTNIHLIEPLLLKILKKLQYIKANKMKNTGLIKHFNLIKKKFYQFLKKHKHKLHLKLCDCFDNDEPWFGNYLYTDEELPLFTELDEILSAIMEWYTILNIITTDKLSIIHAGLYHTKNINHLLINIYNFTLQKPEYINPHKSCVLLTPEIDDKWTRGY